VQSAEASAITGGGEAKIAEVINASWYWFAGSRAFILGCVALSCLAGLCIGLLNGGLDFLMHFLLRLFFRQRRSFPFRAVPFLDFAADRILLYKVGGGYVFIHRLLLEHFASLELETPQ
jgi:hypothetical protein